MAKIRERLRLWIKRTVDRINYLIDVAISALGTVEIQITLLTLLALIASNIVIVEISNNSYSQQLLSTLIAVLVTLLSVYFSIDILSPHLKGSERTHISDSQSIVEEYDDQVLINMYDWIPNSIQREDINNHIAAAVEDVPEEAKPLSDIECELNNDMYHIPENLWGIIEPAEDRIKTIFNLSGSFSTLKPRLDRITEQKLYISKTTYYRSFQTNFCPDLNLGSNRTIRELTKSQLVKDGELVSLENSPFSNHLGIAGMVISADGTMAVGTRSGHVAVDKYAKSLPFSGAANWSDFTESGKAETAVIREIEEELKIGEDDIREIVYLGTTRRMERIGKPDIVTLVLVDEIDVWTSPSKEFTKLDIFDISTESPIESTSELFSPEIADDVVRQLLSEVSESSRHASAGLLSFISLYSRLAYDT